MIGKNIPAAIPSKLLKLIETFVVEAKEWLLNEEPFENLFENWLKMFSIFLLKKISVIDWLLDVILFKFTLDSGLYFSIKNISRLD